MLVFGGFFVYDQSKGLLQGFREIPDYPGPGTGSVTITIPEGATLNHIGDLLVADDVIKSTDAWDRAVRVEEARHQRAARPLPDAAADARASTRSRLLINPGSSRVRSQFTIQEGLRLSEQVSALVKATKIKKSAFEKALDKPDELACRSTPRTGPRASCSPTPTS